MPMSRGEQDPRKPDSWGEERENPFSQPVIDLPESLSEQDNVCGDPRNTDRISR